MIDIMKVVRKASEMYDVPVSQISVRDKQNSIIGHRAQNDTAWNNISKNMEIDLTVVHTWGPDAEKKDQLITWHGWHPVKGWRSIPTAKYKKRTKYNNIEVCSSSKVSNILPRKLWEMPQVEVYPLFLVKQNKNGNLSFSIFKNPLFDWDQDPLQENP